MSLRWQGTARSDCTELIASSRASDRCSSRGYRGLGENKPAGLQLLPEPCQSQTHSLLELAHLQDPTSKETHDGSLSLSIDLELRSYTQL